MQYWLVKSEPDTFSFEQLITDKRTRWDGVRNYQARNNLRAMKAGDLCLFYHSNIGLEIVGIARVVR
jgi:predicted RNA-binding protein with PUA-like domain